MKPHFELLCQLLEQTRKLGADIADGIFIESRELLTAQRLGKPEGLEQSQSHVIGLRAFCGNRQAIVSTTDLSKDRLSDIAAHVVAMARVAPPDPDRTFAPENLLATEIPDLDLLDKNQPDAAWLTEQCKAAESAAMETVGISNSEGAEARISNTTIHLAANSGSSSFAHSYSGSMCSLSVAVLAGSGTTMERDYDFCNKRHSADMESAIVIGKRAAKRVLARMNPRKVNSCTVPIVYDPRVSRELVGIFAGAISGSAVSRGSSFLKDRMNELVFNSNVTIIDDPHIIRGAASKPFDAEGVRNGKRILLEHGVLKSWLLDMRTANKLGLVTTGHATRSAGAAPSPSATNIYMQNGTQPPERLIKEISKGLYVTETFGMGVNIVTGDYSQGASGFWIENGEITFPVSEITIAGTLQQMFQNLTPANDLEFRYSSNAPTVRIDAMTIAGI